MAFLRRLLLGEGLPSTRALHERLPKYLALPVFASDATSSTAYATEEILLALVLAGTGALRLALPVAIAIGVLFTIVVISYRQTVLAYPSGGGAYVVARENLGTHPGLIAGGALLTDYTLGVAVSIEWIRNGDRSQQLEVVDFFVVDAGVGRQGYGVWHAPESRDVDVLIAAILERRHGHDLDRAARAGRKRRAVGGQEL